MRTRKEVLEVHVRFLPEPCLWCWEIVDVDRRGALIGSSWAREWMAYPTREEALAAGRARLAEVRSAGAGRAARRGRRRGESAA
jgi:hypothetical protein